MSGTDEKIKELLSRDVEDVIKKNHLRAALASGKKLRVKLGIDPTSPDLHLGHAVVLRKLRAFQDLGHTVVLIIGDFTAQVGDPSGRSETRKMLSSAEVKHNEKEYLRHAGKVINMKKAEIFHNNEWFGHMGLPEIMQLAAIASIQQVLRRADFKKRLAENIDVTMLEMLYPLLQGYDSVQVKADVELGGVDQLFNLLMGRQVQKRFGMPEQDILTVPLLEGLDGKKKMSKTYGNYIGLDDVPADMFGKTMSLPDSLVTKYFMFCTGLSEDEIGKLKKTLKPKALKERLALEIVKLYHGEKQAAAAQEYFDRTFSKKEIPDDVPELKIKRAKILALDLVVASGVMKSKGEARRLIEQGGFEVGGKVIKNPQEELTLKGGEAVRVGKRHFIRIKI
ncbi:MAG: tyrosine--tRNA ligase [Minisyncoccia bacterium]|jgi:tyrosyl-tRNA synthetase